MDKEKSLAVKKDLTKKQYLIMNFLLYSFIGWLMETLYAILTLGHFEKRGFLFGPICPIYGWSAIILILFLNKYKKNSVKLFFISALVFSIFEYIVGFVLDAIFAAKWWDYTHEFFNLNGRITLMFTFFWGIISLLFINHIHPFIESKLKKQLKKSPYYLQVFLIRLLFTLFLADTFISIIKHL